MLGRTALGRAGNAVTVLLAARSPATHASLDDPGAVARLLDALRETGADDAVPALLARDPATHASLDDPIAVAGLLNALRETGAGDAVTALLAARDPATHASLDDPIAVAGLLNALRETGAATRSNALADRAAGYASLRYPPDVTRLLEKLTPDVARLLETLREVGAADAARTGRLDRQRGHVRSLPRGPT